MMLDSYGGGMKNLIIQLEYGLQKLNLEIKIMALVN